MNLKLYNHQTYVLIFRSLKLPIMLTYWSLFQILWKAMKHYMKRMVSFSQENF
ncbi:hypothetical protein RhiirA4_411835 [Rhizophagus irregularis]|uniref:Uncharacterized protein n=1 Tax=Rhizophagus irregularis TaxID=588596 RepID=A0A2I1HFR5_9GLOM|nr:hypothetical protein RhiirA4_411835 [Rhizophagus irregularis]